MQIQVVEASGWGWDLFDIRTVGSVGEIFAKKTLDYEEETHRKGFKFLVQVTDKVSLHSDLILISFCFDSGFNLNDSL